ncbi:MAG: molecular chaperone DnaJ [Clostridiales bacterium GWF2_38_85]|nr:MAG: molecular chaperone DnaJ [Clostridiales bacterium GWF2_38_85]HBL83586.1 molecular chaperone DnaJ [Clostridiales bacterium]
MADKKDYYEVLDVAKGASEDDIKKAYKKMAKKFHPDMNSGDKTAEVKFKEVNEAYAVLSDADKRARYDQYGHAGVDPNFGAGPGGGGFGGADFGNFDFSDIFGGFSSFFGGMGGDTARRRNSPQRGEDVGISVSITFEEAAFGSKKDVSYARVEECGTCHGSGTAHGSAAETCSKCKGTGQIKVNQRMMGITMQSVQACDMCGGSGKIIKEPCSDCKGKGYIRRTKKLEVNIPSGIDNGQRIVLKGQGSAGLNSGPYGDLYVQVSIREHQFFQRDGQDIYVELPISFPEAALGAKVIVPTLEGKSELTIPEGTQNGSVFNMKNKGIVNVNGSGRGNLYVKVAVDIPKNLNEKQKTALRNFADACEDKNYTKKQSFFDKFKK